MDASCLYAGSGTYSGTRYHSICKLAVKGMSLPKRKPIQRDGSDVK